MGFGKSTSSTETKLSGIQVQTSLLGQPIPIGWGRAKVSCNLIDYVAFTATPHTQKTGKGGSSSSTTYTYTASIIMALAEGPITGVRTVYKDSSVFTNGAKTALAQAGLSLATGTLTQAPWGYMTSRFPDHALGYSSLAYVYAQDYELGSGASLPNHSFEVDFSIQFGPNGDAVPADVARDFLTNASYGVTGWASGLIGDWSDWTAYAKASNLLVSPVLDSSSSGADFLKRITDASNSDFVWSEGVLKCRPYGDAAVTGNGVTWTPDLTPIFDLTEDDFLSEVTQEIVDQSDAKNYVQVEYLDRSNQYEPAVAVAQDLDDIVTFGLRKGDVVQMHEICDATIAQQAAQLLLQRSLYIRDRYTFTVPEDFAALDPMDYVTLTTTVDGIQLDRQLVLIEEINENESGDLEITATAVPGQTASAAAYATHSADGYRPQVDVDPGDVSSPVFFAAPPGLASNANEIWLAAAGGANWGGCRVWMSYDDASYTQIGTITQPARYGVLSSALPSHADPDAASTLSVDLSVSDGILSAATHAAADAGLTLCLVGNELLSYADLTLTGPNAYALSYLRRGQKGSAIASHASGSRFVRLDDAIFTYAHPTADIGKTIYIKLQSFNSYGRAEQDLATLSAYSYVVAPAASAPDDVSTATISQLISTSKVQGLTITGAASGTVTVAGHTRIYTDKSVTVSGGAITGLTVGTGYHLYYDDQLRAGGAVGFGTASAAEDAKTSAAHPYRHYLGSVTIPATGTSTGDVPVSASDVVASVGGVPAADIADGAAAAVQGLNTDGTVKTDKVATLAIQANAVTNIVSVNAGGQSWTDAINAGTSTHNLVSATFTPSSASSNVLLIITVSGFGVLNDGSLNRYDASLVIEEAVTGARYYMAPNTASLTSTMTAQILVSGISSTTTFTVRAFVAGAGTSTRAGNGVISSATITVMELKR